MSTVVGQNFTMYQGESVRVVVAVIDGDRAPAALAGGSAVWAMRRGPRRLQKTATIDGSDVIVEIEPAETEALPQGEYEHQLQVTDVENHPVIVTAGRVTLKHTIIEKEA